MPVRFGDFVFDSGARQLTRDGATLPLSPKAFQLLEILVHARPRVVPKQEIIDSLWQDVTVEEANVRNLVAEVRRTLGDQGRRPKYIRTAHRIGYAFIAKASKVTQGNARLFNDHHSFFLSDGTNLVGRDADCAIVLDLSGVSRRHAKITLTETAAIVEDLGSKNGTWLNGQRIDSPTELRDDDRLHIGVATLTFRRRTRPGSTDTLDS